MLFQLKALGNAGQVELLRLEAASEADARREAESRGLAVFSAQPVQALATRAYGARRAPLEVLGFAQELLVLLRAGMSLVGALETMAEKERNVAARAVIEALLLRLRRGGRLSEAMDEAGGTFPALLVAGVRASERTGDLEETLQRYCEYAGRMQEARKKVISALIYPVMLLLVGFLVSAFLIGFVVPKFAGVYKEVGGEMPWASALLFEVGRVIGAYPGAIALGLLLWTAGLVAVLKLPATRLWLGQRLRALPGVGQRLRVYELARLYRTLSMLLRGGTPIVPALGLASTMLSSALRPQLANASRQIAQGEPISRALEGNGLTTMVGSRMLSVGEKSGGMADMLARIADYHDEETQRWVDWAVRLFEPVMMAILGVVIGGIVVLLYMPIFDLAGTVQQ